MGDPAWRLALLGKDDTAEGEEQFMNTEVTDIDTLRAQEALMALRGLHCSRCGRALDRNKEEYACVRCHIAHCPYCGKSAQDRCRHHIAANTYGKWNIYGLTCAKLSRVPAGIDQKVDWSDRQKRDLFREAYPLLEIYGQGMLEQPVLSRLMHALISLVTSPVTSVRVYANDRHDHHVFAAQPDRARQEAQQALSCLQEGMKRLAETKPDADSVLVAELSAASDDADTTALCFSSEGELLATAAGKSVTLWNAATGQKQGELSAGIKVTSLAFSPGNALLTAASDEGCVTWSLAGGQAVHNWRTPNCRMARDYYERVYCKRIHHRVYKSLGTYDPHVICGQRIGYLHGGASILYITDNIATLLDSASGQLHLTLDHRSPITHTLFSPDGITLATIQTAYRGKVLLWRIPATVVQTKGKSGK
jgi:hypothetical protein